MIVGPPSFYSGVTTFTNSASDGLCQAEALAKAGGEDGIRTHEAGY